MGPLELMYSWQALLCAAAAFGVTQTVKRIVDVIQQKKANGLQEEERKKLREKAKTLGLYRSDKKKTPSDGELLRRTNPIVNRIVIPVIPVVAGALYAVVVPLHPETLVEYAEAHLSGFWVYMGYMGWGGACGQFSTMLFDKIKDLLKQAPPATT